MAFVYIHTNKINGKKYVGQTRQQPEKRWQGGLGYTKQPKFFNAILKYGWDNFSHEVIQVASSEEADRIEQELISRYDSIENGYNVDKGGKHPFHTDKSKQNISASQKGRKRSEEFKQKCSERRGWHHSAESKEKNAAAHRGIPKPKKKYITPGGLIVEMVPWNARRCHPDWVQID